MPIPPQLPFLPTDDIGPDSDLVKIFDISDGLEKMVHPEALIGGALSTKQDVLVSGTNIKTINSTSLLGSGDIAISTSPAGTAGQIQFSDGSAFAADSNLYWDNTNKRLGIGTSSPAYPIDNAGITKSQGIALANVGHNVVSSNEVCSRGALQLSVRNSGGVLENQFYLTGSLTYSTATAFGIGTTTPTARLQVKGSGSTSATTALLVQNSSGTELLKVRDDGIVSVPIEAQLGSIRHTSDKIISSSIRVQPISGGVCVSALATSAVLSAILQADSTTKGFLPPRMTTAEKTAISTPAAGLVVYDTDTNKLCCYNGTSWNDLF